MRRTPVLLATVVAALALAGCSSEGSAPSSSASGSGSASAVPISGTVTVLAAASLTETFDALAKQFEAQHPGVTVKLSYGGSDALAQQIVAGAPVDVFASASDATMKTVTDASLNADAPQLFATNVLEIAVPKGNPAQIVGIDDFADADKTIALCAETVPCGAAAQKVFTAVGISPSVDTYEQDVKSVLTKVELDEVDAGLVYQTDVKAAGDKVEGVDFAEAQQAVTDYPIALVKDAPNAAAGQSWIDFVLGATGQKALADAGFGAP